MKPQSMQATAPSSSGEPHEGHFAGVGIGPEPDLAPFPDTGFGSAAGAGITGMEAVDEALAGAGGGGATGGGAPGTMNGCLHDGHCNRLPATLSGACIVF
jgi:hypothetical protein